MILKLNFKSIRPFSLTTSSSRDFSRKFLSNRPKIYKSPKNATVIDGKAIAERLKTSLSKDIKTLIEQSKFRKVRPPKLGYVIVGDRPDSQLYVKMKKKVCENLGIKTTGKHFEEDTQQDEVLEYIMSLNADPSVDGILTQFPLPDHIDENIVSCTIDYRKDVDGVHPLNMAAMARHETPMFTPCTPKGVMKLIKSVCPEIKGKKATVIGRSNIVGMPISLLLQKEYATVTLCHIHTQNLKDEVESADIIVSATGSPQLIKGDFVKPGAIVIDVGTRFVKDKSSPSGKKLVGDVDFNSVAKKPVHLTPVPGGVGPMTIAMLMDNIVYAWKENLKLGSKMEHIHDKKKESDLMSYQSSMISNDLTYF